MSQPSPFAALSSWGFKPVVAALAVAERLVPQALYPVLEAGRLIRAAHASPSPDAIQGLLRLIAALRAESQPSFFGALSIPWDFKRLLGNAQLVETAHASNPALSQTPVRAPVFILGLPRSGTTFLHTLLAQDPANLIPRNWQTIDPAPRPANFNPAQSRPARAVDRQLKFFATMAPGFAQAHPITADSPQECSEITAHVFQSLRFDTTFRVPSYQAWLNQNGHHNAFKFHRKFLQFLQSASPGAQWFLKCPDHIFTIDAILHTYPDARFIIAHRDPLKVFASVAHLTEIIRRPFIRGINPAEIGAQVTTRWLQGIQSLIAFDQRDDIAPARKIHIQYENLATNPLAVIARIYAQFGLEFSTSARAGMARFLNANPRGGYSGLRQYPLGHFNIIPERLAPQYADYVNHFNIAA